MNLKAIFPLLFLLSVASAAGELQADLSHRIEHELRATYNFPESVKIAISGLRTSEFPNMTLSVANSGNHAAMGV